MDNGNSSRDKDETFISPSPIITTRQDRATKNRQFRLLDLPSELLDQVLEYLSPVALANVCQTCKRLNRHSSAERLWRAHLVGCAPYENNSYEPYASWKELYGTFFPYWFLLKRKVWFSDRNGYWDESKGALLLAQWDAESGGIVLCYLHAMNASTLGFSEWTHDSTVQFVHFAPRLRIHGRIMLDPKSMKPGINRLQEAVRLTPDAVEHIDWASTVFIFPAISIPPERQARSMALWPPNSIPALERTRRESPSAFRDPQHQPNTYEQMCTTLFRLRRCHQSTQIPSDGYVETYSTILPEYFIPTAEKPYQGLWVGDYSAHGCEFILIIQSRPEDAQHIPNLSEFSSWRDTYSYRPEFIDPHLPPASEPDPPGNSGSLYAIKLTGDRNVPRGQPSWIAPDIGRGGLVRIAHEPEFHGARVVSSAGHIAQDRFTRDRYTPCHLIMISENLLAQHWLEMSHISFFKRMDIDEVLRTEYQNAAQMHPWSKTT